MASLKEEYQWITKPTPPFIFLCHKQYIPGNYTILFFVVLRADSDVSGVLRFEGRDYQLTLLNLPSVTETYKTYDDINLVKTGDIGQVLVVGEISEEEANSGEISDGVTLPLRKARTRIFRKATTVPPEAVARVESQILDVLSVGLGCYA